MSPTTELPPPNISTSSSSSPSDESPIPTSSSSEGSSQALLGVSFPDKYQAQEFLLAAARVSATGTQRVRDAVFVTKDAEGKTVVHETADFSTSSTVMAGGLWVSLIGLILGGPVGWIAGAAIGAGVGAATAKVVDLGVPDEWVSWFRDVVRESTTTVVLLVENYDRQAMGQELARFPGAVLVHTTLGPDAVDSWSRSLTANGE